MILFEKARTRGVAHPAHALPAFELWSAPETSIVAKAPDLRALASLARANARLIAAVALVVALLCAGAVGLIFNQYAATATILFDPRNARVTATPEVLPDIGPDSIAIESLVQVAKSDGFLSALIEREGLASDTELAGGAASADQKATALEKLRDRLTIARRGATYVVDVSAKSGDAQKSARIANAAAALMVDSERDLRSGSNQRAVDFIGGKLTQLRERVSAEEAAIAKLRTDLKITDAGQGEVLQERRVTELNQQFALANARTGEARALVDQLRETNFAALGALPSAIQSPVLSALREDYARLTRQAADRATVLGARHPDVIATNAQLEDVRRQIGAEKERLIASAKSDFLEARKREESISDELRKAQAESGASDQQAVQLRDLERTEKSDQAVYEQLLGRQKELNEMKGLGSDDIRIVSPAVAPTRTNMPKPSLVLAVSALIGLLAGLASAVVRDGVGRSSVAAPPAWRPPRLEASAILPALAPPPSRDGSLADGEAARHFARLCASRSMRKVGRDGIILVTSARPGEGKSTVAANVAACLAKGGPQVLLMQLAGSPSVTPRRGCGLIDVVAGECALDEAVLWFGENAPSILPLGGSGEAAAVEALLSGAAMRRLIHDCRRSFDLLVIDGTSPIETPALRALASLADAVLMVVEWNKTDAAAVEQAMQGIDPRRVGVVLNKVDPDHYGAVARSAKPAPAAVMGEEPVERERRGAAFAGRAQSTKRTRRRRSGFGKAD